jgi:hypothetical protein
MGREVRQLPRYPRRHRPGAIEERWAEYGWVYLDGRIKIDRACCSEKDNIGPAIRPPSIGQAARQAPPSPAWLPVEDMRRSVRPVPCA